MSRKFIKTNSYSAGLALSVKACCLDSSPKGRALGKTGKFAWTAKASPFEERLPPAGGRCRAATKGGVWHGVSRDGEGEGADLVQYTAFLSSGGDFTQIYAVGLCHVYK